jgi:hypothetical protein
MVGKDYIKKITVALQVCNKYKILQKNVEDCRKIKIVKRL